jgi:hypothetical protein
LQAAQPIFDVWPIISEVQQCTPNSFALPARCSSGPAAQPAVALRQPAPGPSEPAPPLCPWRTRQGVRRPPPRRPCQARLPRLRHYLARVPELPRALTLAYLAPPPDQAEPRAAAAAADSSQPPCRCGK